MRLFFILSLVLFTLGDMPEAFAERGDRRERGDRAERRNNRGERRNDRNTGNRNNGRTERRERRERTQPRNTGNGNNNRTERRERRERRQPRNTGNGNNNRTERRERRERTQPRNTGNGNNGRVERRERRERREGRVERRERRERREGRVERRERRERRESRVDRRNRMRRNYRHRPNWRRGRNTDYVTYRHNPFRNHRRHVRRYNSRRRYHTTIPYRFIYSNRWLRIRVSWDNGYRWDNEYPYYIYNGYSHRYSNYDTCNYELVDGNDNDVIRTYNNYTCSTGYDLCSDLRDDLNASEYGYRYFCSEKLDGEVSTYSWDLNDDFYSDISDDFYYEDGNYYDDIY
jgi:hypothetical protein